LVNIPSFSPYIYIYPLNFNSTGIEVKSFLYLIRKRNFTRAVESLTERRK
jgi:hypothetical protein